MPAYDAALSTDEARCSFPTLELSSVKVRIDLAL
jgi:hypothetical protein